MIFDKAVLLSCAGGGDEPGVLKCTWELTPTWDEGGQCFVLAMEREDSSNPNCWLYSEIIYEPEGAISYFNVCVSMPAGYYDSEDVTVVKLSIGGWSGYPFTNMYEESEPYRGDGEYGIYNLSANFDDNTPIPAFSDLADGQKVKVTVRIKGLDSLQGS